MHDFDLASLAYMYFLINETPFSHSLNYFFLHRLQKEWSRGVTAQSLNR